MALTFQLGKVEQVLATTAACAGASLGDLRHQAELALDALRELAHGVYPPLRADRGLAAALQPHARRLDLEIVIDAKGLARHSRELEAAVYFCALEALQNTLKHAHARRAEISLIEEGGYLTFLISDDGEGFEPAFARHVGTGLAGMTDRIAAEGGRLNIESSPGQGTRIRGILPVIDLNGSSDRVQRLQLRSIGADSDGDRGGQPARSRGRAWPVVRR